MLRFPAALTALLVTALPAAASSSAWIQTEGGTVRLVTSGLADDKGKLRGALEIKLEAGWKTYWRDPGGSGVPPQINLSEASDAADARLLFPAPERMSDAYASWAGYKNSVTIPVLFSFPEARAAGIIEGSLFLGICETICIPVEAPFSFDAGADPDNPQDAVVVQSAFAALPEAARAGFRVSEVRREGASLRIAVELPGQAGEPELFLAPPENLQVGMPELKEREGREAVFTAEILGGSAAKGEAKLDYTLVLGKQAADGQIALP
ncbi:protein-disulfide reductase DsbD domain-containing protein [Chelativorans sp.]|uniref:protein-disulfide reductase DsbD domain-containing protein n=1 Tax=Chelativorans sp. TaxID=2203393 RepID=UPI0028112BB6|nr:protein-disulfide reductase DsbD domain-containing protein [Chelativorans sp.]